MVDTIRALLAEMADALDHNRQCLMDDRRLTHPLADRARAALAAEPGARIARLDAEIEAGMKRIRALAAPARAALAAAQGEAGPEGMNDPRDVASLSQVILDAFPVTGLGPVVADHIAEHVLARWVRVRWGRPAQPAPPAEGEIDQLVSQLYDYAQGEADNGWHDDAARFRRAAELLPRLVEAMDAFTSLRNEILHGLDGFDPDQTNAVLDVIDNHTPEWV